MFKSTAAECNTMSGYKCAAVIMAAVMLMFTVVVAIHMHSNWACVALLDFCVV